jgi:hypothetical protein
MFSLVYGPRPKKQSFIIETGCVPLRYEPRPKRAEHRESSIIDSKPPRLRHLKMTDIKYIAVIDILEYALKFKVYFGRIFTNIKCRENAK